MAEMFTFISSVIVYDAFYSMLEMNFYTKKATSKFIIKPDIHAARFIRGEKSQNANFQFPFF